MFITPHFVLLLANILIDSFLGASHVRKILLARAGVLAVTFVGSYARVSLR